MLNKEASCLLDNCTDIDCNSNARTIDEPSVNLTVILARE